MDNASLQPLSAGLVPRVGGSDVLPDLLDHGQQLRVFAGVEPGSGDQSCGSAGSDSHVPRPSRRSDLTLGESGPGGDSLSVQAPDVVVQLL